MLNDSFIRWEFQPIDKKHQRNHFDCGYAVLNDYLKKYARQNHEKGIAIAADCGMIGGGSVFSNKLLITQSFIGFNLIMFFDTDNQLILALLQFACLVIITGCLPLLQSLLLIIAIFNELPSNPVNTEAHISLFDKYKKNILGLTIILFVSTLGGWLAASFPGYLAIISFYIIIALIGTINSYVFWIQWLDFGWYIELAGINKIFSGQLTISFYFSTVLFSISYLILVLIWYFFSLSMSMSMVVNSQYEFTEIISIFKKYFKYTSIGLILIFCVLNVWAIYNISNILGVSVLAIVTLSLHSLLGLVFLIGKKISLKQLTTQKEKIALSFIIVSITAIGILLGWSLKMA